MSRTSSGGEDLATLSAVAEVVVNLSIAERTHSMYGSDHPIAERATRKVLRALGRALGLADPVVLRFTPEAVFVGAHCLERDHPIYRRFARKLWGLGLGELRLRSGIGEDELVSFLALLAEGVRTRRSHRETERSFREAAFRHVEVRSLRELLGSPRGSQALPLSPGEERRRWDELMRRLGRTADGATEAAEEVAATGDAPPIEDYATAVVDYMRHVQRAERQGEILQRSETGQKLVELLEEMNPELRHQILSQAVRAPEIDAAFLARLADLTGREEFVESLRRLNAEGQALPPSVYQTLTLLSLVSPADPGGAVLDAASVPEEAFSSFAHGIGSLFEPDRRDDYVSDDYDAAIQRLEGQFERLARGASSETTQTSLDFSAATTERHFLFTVQELLASSDVMVRESLRLRVVPEVDVTFQRLLRERRSVASREALELSRSLRQENPEQDLPAAPWEDPETVAGLVQGLVEEDGAELDDQRRLLQALGAPAVPSLVELLRNDERITVRKLALETMVEMEASPAPLLLPLLDPAEPWFVHRNALHILGERGDARAVERALALWRQSGTRSREAILGYLTEAAPGEAAGLAVEALSSRDPELVLRGARVALRLDPPRTRDVMETADRVARERRASPLHLELLRILARRGGEQGRRFVASARSRHAPRLPWRRLRWRREIDRILGGGA